MIVFDESEYGHYALSDLSIRRVARFFGLECANRLIYNGDRYHAPLNRLDTARDRPDIEERLHTYDDTGPYDIWYPSDDQEPEDTAEDAKVRSLADTG